MTTKCLRYDMIMIQHDRYTYIHTHTHTHTHTYIYTHTHTYDMLWYEICDNWYIYDMIYCDAICYGMIFIYWKLLCLEAWNVMIWYIYVIWMIWCDWHAKQRTSMKYNPDVCMKDMINAAWNDMKYDMYGMLTRLY